VPQARDSFWNIGKTCHLLGLATICKFKKIQFLRWKRKSNQLRFLTCNIARPNWFPFGGGTFLFQVISHLNTTQISSLCHRKKREDTLKIGNISYPYEKIFHFKIFHFGFWIFYPTFKPT
jgi:hypothetical protein